MMVIGHEGLRPYVEALWGWDSALHERNFREHFVPDTISIIQVEGEDAGYVKVEEADDHIYLDGIYLSSAHRGRGVGTEVLRDLLARGRAEGKPLRLQVLASNPAQHLYRRLGFRPVAETTTHIRMEAGGSEPTNHSARR